MPQLHLTKVAFGCRDLDALRTRVAARAENGQLRSPTRMRPKRAAEAIGGNLYWIVKHRIVGGNQILEFEDRPDGRIDIPSPGGRDGAVRYTDWAIGRFVEAARPHAPALLRVADAADRAASLARRALRKARRVAAARGR